MNCISPITGWRSKRLNANGNRPITFNRSEGFVDMEVTVPCGRCIGCRIQHAASWALRCTHEAQMHKDNCFITLTYNDEHYPADHSIHKEELQKFFKRLRKATGKKFRYFACGEYGDERGRPHYHAILFGLDFDDKKKFHRLGNYGHIVHTSKFLEKVWGNGYCYIGSVTYESASYVARYIQKKRKGKPDEVDPKTGKTNAEYYMLVDEVTGEVFDIEPEFCIMSRGKKVKYNRKTGKSEPLPEEEQDGGIGWKWYKKYGNDMSKGYITHKGRTRSLPAYYLHQLRLEDIEKYTAVTRNRDKFVVPMDGERLVAKKKILTQKTNNETRPYEVITR
jgi:hypothetical protein